MKFLALILVLLAAQPSLAKTRDETLGDQFKLNRATQQALQDARLGDAIVAESEHSLRAVYSFALQGGAQGVKTLLDASTGKAAKLPKGAVVRDCLIDVITTPTSGGSSALKVGTGQSTNDLKLRADDDTFSGLMACIPVGSAATAIKLTADATMSTSIESANLTAGKFYVIVHYEMSDTQ